MKREIIGLMKNGSVKIMKEKKAISLWKEAEWYLLPMEKYNTKGRIIIKPSRFMEMTKIEVEVKMRIDYAEYDSGYSTYTELPAIKKVFYDSISFYNFIQSLDIVYTSNQYMYDLGGNYKGNYKIDFNYINIEFYKNDMFEYEFHERGKYNKEWNFYDCLIYAESNMKNEKIYIFPDNKFQGVRINLATNSWKKIDDPAFYDISKHKVLKEPDVTYLIFGLYHIDTNLIYLLDIKTLKDLYRISFIRAEMEFSIVDARGIDNLDSGEFDCVSMPDILSLMELYEAYLQLYQMIMMEFSYASFIGMDSYARSKVRASLRFHYMMNEYDEMKISSIKELPYVVGDNRSPLIEYLSLLHVGKEETDDELSIEEE